MSSPRRINPAFVLIFAGLLAAQPAGWLSRIKDLAWQKDVAAAQKLVEAERPADGAVTAHWLAGVSWLARGASFAERWDVAEKYATEALEGSVKLLEKRPLDADRDLPTALGASIEVLSRAYDAGGDRAGAVEFLHEQRALYQGTSIETRIQKNLLLLSLEGKPMPPLETARYIGDKPRTPDELKGKVALFYFWAHWCSDCKRQKPILEALQEKYADRGLVIVGPTRLYGYIAGGRDATPQQEWDYIENAYQRAYPIPSWMDVPVSTQNFVNFGVSSTPTLVLVDRSGIVRLYHPGDLGYEELAGHIEKLIG